MISQVDVPSSFFPIKHGAITLTTSPKWPVHLRNLLVYLAASSLVAANRAWGKRSWLHRRPSFYKMHCSIHTMHRQLSDICPPCSCYSSSNLEFQQAFQWIGAILTLNGALCEVSMVLSKMRWTCSYQPLTALGWQGGSCFRSSSNLFWEALAWSVGNWAHASTGCLHLTQFSWYGR